MLSALFSPLSEAEAAAPGVSAQCAVLSCGGRLVYEKNADVRRLIASTTKIMTALVVLERESLDREITIKPEYLRTEGSSMYLRAGETITIRELLYGLMLMSGNDAGLTLAYVCGDGDPQQFVALMNETAQRLGLENTSFANPHGLDHENHYSTARDLAKLTAYALENELFAEIVSTKVHTSETRSMKNHNKLLWNVDGVIGVKTGFTKKAGRCLVSACRREERTFIAVTLNAPSDWNDHALLYEMAFAGLQEQNLCKKGMHALVMPVMSGASAACNLVYGADCTVKLTEEQRKHVRTVFRASQFVYAPVVRGQLAGYAEFEVHGTVLASVPLFYAKTICEEAGERKSKLWDWIVKIAD